jgi:hypothetical protein
MLTGKVKVTVHLEPLKRMSFIVEELAAGYPNRKSSSVSQFACCSP